MTTPIYRGIVPRNLAPPAHPKSPHKLAECVLCGAIVKSELHDNNWKWIHVFHKCKPQETKLSAAVELGRRGGLKGDLARAMSLTDTERSEAARKAASARWNKKDKEDMLSNVFNNISESQKEIAIDWMHKHGIGVAYNIATKSLVIENRNVNRVFGFPVGHKIKILMNNNRYLSIYDAVIDAKRLIDLEIPIEFSI